MPGIVLGARGAKTNRTQAARKTDAEANVRRTGRHKSEQKRIQDMIQTTGPRGGRGHGSSGVCVRGAGGAMGDATRKTQRLRWEAGAAESPKDNTKASGLIFANLSLLKPITS